MSEADNKPRGASAMGGSASEPTGERAAGNSAGDSKGERAGRERADRAVGKLPSNPSSESAGNPAGKSVDAPSGKSANNSKDKSAGNPAGNHSTDNQARGERAERAASESVGNPSGNSVGTPSGKSVGNPSGNHSTDNQSTSERAGRERAAGNSAGDSKGERAERDASESAGNLKSNPSGNSVDAPAGSSAGTPRAKSAGNSKGKSAGNSANAPAGSEPKGAPWLAKARESTQEENRLRPARLEDFKGQSKTQERLGIIMGAAKARGEPTGHILLHGPPGLGKTTLAHIIANEMGTQLRISSGPAIERAGDLAGLLSNLERGDILFIDEIHRLSKVIEEYLYSAMEDYCIDILIDQGPNARSVRLELAPFTLVGATTRTGQLSAPLRSRFTLQTRLDYYSHGVLTGIVERSCKLLGVQAEPKAIAEIARRARGTPRVANHLLCFARDFAEQRHGGVLDAAVAAAALELLEIDANGMDEMDKRLLRTLGSHYAGGPVGLSTLAVALSEDESTLAEVHEPYLIQEGWLARTAQGRVLTPKSAETFGLSLPKTGPKQENLPWKT